MSLLITLDFPPEIEEKLCRDGADIEVEVKEAFLVDLFRRGKLSHYELSQALGCDRFEADAFLKRHGAFEGSWTMPDLEADRQTLQRLLPKDSDAPVRPSVDDEVIT
jgi:hypothetical protein